MSLIQALEATTTTRNALTANGMVTHSTTSNHCVDLFGLGGAMRTKPVGDLNTLFSAALGENPLDAMKIMFYLRDVRGGQGNREPFRNMLKFLATVRPAYVKANLANIPEFGRWDDLFCLLDTSCEAFVLDFYASALRAGDGLAAKWAPRETSAQKKIAFKLMQHMGLRPKQYRKLLVNATKVVETAMCARQWDSITFDHVPSVAMSRYTKAFAKNASEAWTSYISKVEKGEATIHAGTLYPHDIVHKVRHSAYDAGLEAQWKALPDFLAEDNRIMPILDTSGSMSCPAGKDSKVQCVDVCLALGLYLAERNRGPFQNTAITFSDNPRFYKASGLTLQDRINSLYTGEVAGSTNLNKAFDLILKTAIQYRVPEKDMPTTLLILSDMEFNPSYGYGSQGSYSQTASEMIRAKYAAAGYKMPTVIYWNLNGRIENTPVKQHESGVALVSGFSPSILKYICTSVYEEVTPYMMMKQVIDSERYSRVVV